RRGRPNWFRKSIGQGRERRESVARIEVFEPTGNDLEKRLGPEVAAFVSTHFGEHYPESRILWDLRRERVEAIAGREPAVGVLEKLNRARWVNKYIRAVNSRLAEGGVFVGCAEVNEQR